MISCPECHIGLPDDVKRCPACQRLLIVPPFARGVGWLALIMMPLAVVLGVAWMSHGLESKLLWRQTSAGDAYRAARSYMETADELRGAVKFSNQKESVIEQWGPTRFRVAGYVDVQPASGARTHNSYSCVLQYHGSDRWEVEDLHIERVQ